MITDKTKYAALLYFHIRDSKASDPNFTASRVMGEKILDVVRGERFPSLDELRLIAKVYPSMAYLLTRRTRRTSDLVSRGQEMFAAMLARGNARLRGPRRPGRGSANLPPLPDVILGGAKAIEAAKIQVIGVGSSTVVAMRFATLMGQCPNAQNWLTLIKEADAASISLTDLIASFDTATKDIKHAQA